MNLQTALRHGIEHMAAMENAAMWRKAGMPAKADLWLARAERLRNSGKTTVEWKSPMDACHYARRQQGEATRARIMAYLGNGPRRAADIAKELGRSKAHTSELLRVLRDAGMIQSSSLQGPRGILWGLPG